MQWTDGRMFFSVSLNRYDFFFQRNYFFSFFLCQATQLFFSLFCNTPRQRHCPVVHFLRYPGKGWIFYDLYDGWMTLRLGATF